MLQTILWNNNINSNSRPVNISLEKTYDATTDVSAGDLKTNGITNTVLGHSLTLNGTGTMSNSNVGIGKSVTLEHLVLLELNHLIIL